MRVSVHRHDHAVAQLQGRLASLQQQAEGAEAARAAMARRVAEGEEAEGQVRGELARALGELEEVSA